MERLTHKARYEAGYKANKNVHDWQCVDKLGKLEDLQEQGRLIVQVFEIETVRKCEKCGDEERVVKETWVNPELMEDDDFDIFFWTKEQAEEALKRMEV